MVALDPILASSKFRGIPKLVIGHFCRGDYKNSAVFMDRIPTFMDVISDIMYSLDSICQCQLVMKLFGSSNSTEKSPSCMNPSAINGEYINSTAIMENQPSSDNVDGQEKSKQRLSGIILSLTELQLEPFDQLVRAHLDRYDYIVFNCIGKVSL